MSAGGAPARGAMWRRWGGYAHGWVYSYQSVFYDAGRREIPRRRYRRPWWARRVK